MPGDLVIATNRSARAERRGLLNILISSPSWARLGQVPIARRVLGRQLDASWRADDHDPGPAAFERAPVTRHACASSSYSPPRTPHPISLTLPRIRTLDQQLRKLSGIPLISTVRRTFPSPETPFITSRSLTGVLDPNPASYRSSAASGKRVATATSPAKPPSECSGFRCSPGSPAWPGRTHFGLG
jgi:hypothetical protein